MNIILYDTDGSLHSEPSHHTCSYNKRFNESIFPCEAVVRNFYQDKESEHKDYEGDLQTEFNRIVEWAMHHTSSAV